MRRIISAQSWDSVPPAPALMEIKQELRSWGPESILWNSAALPPFPVGRSAGRLPPGSRHPPPRRPVRSGPGRLPSAGSACPTSGPVFSMTVRSLRIFWAASVSSQKPGTAIIASISWISSRLSSTSKRPPKLGDPLCKCFYSGHFFSEHACSFINPVLRFKFYVLSIMLWTQNLKLSFYFAFLNESAATAAAAARQTYAKMSPKRV